MKSKSQFSQTVLALLISFMMISCEPIPEATKASSNQKSAVAETKTSDRFLSELKKVRDDPSQQKEYLAIINDLLILVVEQIRKDPETFQPFLQEMLEIAAKASPGLAIQIENFASEKVKQEMERIKREYNTEKFAAQEKQIVALKEENSQFQKIAKERDNFSGLVAELREQLTQTKEELRKKDEETNGLKAEVEKFQEMAKDRDEFFSKVGKLQRELDQVKTAQTEKDREIEKLKGKLGLPTGKEVPVALVNHWMSGTAGIKFTEKSSGRSWLFTAPVSPTLTEVKLPPGNYTVECHYEGELWGKRDKIVTAEPSTAYENKWYHCAVHISNSSLAPLQ